MEITTSYAYYTGYGVTMVTVLLFWNFSQFTEFIDSHLGKTQLHHKHLKRCNT